MFLDDIWHQSGYQVSHIKASFADNPERFPYNWGQFCWTVVLRYSWDTLLSTKICLATSIVSEEGSRSRVRIQTNSGNEE